MAADRIDPPRSAAYVVEGQADAIQVVGIEVLPSDGPLRPVPLRGDPTNAGCTKRTIPVVDEQLFGIRFH